MLGGAALDAIPDWCEGERLAGWTARAIAEARAVTDRCADRVVSLDGAALPARHLGPHGHFASAAWRRFAAAIFSADLACYPAPADQVDFPRLVSVLHAARAGFRLFLAPGADGPVPVGYSGVYPIDEAAFSRLERGDAGARKVEPAAVVGARPFVHLFNYSVVAPLRRTAVSRALLLGLAADLAALDPRGLSAIVVSTDGARVAERFGLRRTGSPAREGRSDGIYAVRRA